MMRIVLCADTESLRYPALLGLEGENLEGAPWIEAFTKAAELRAHLKEAAGPCEVWVSGADDMDGVNLAAALKHDRSDHKVVLVGQRLTGSALSRAKAAGVDGALNAEAFARRYAEEKRSHSPQGAPDRPIAGAAAMAPGAGEGPASAEVPSLAPGALAAGPAAAATAPLPAIAPTAAPDQAAAVQAMPGTVTAPMPARPAPRAVAGRSAMVLAVASGSGGAGRSAVSVVAAHLAAAQGHRVLLLDCDLQFGDCALLAGAAPGPTMDAVLADPGLLARLEAAPGVPVVVGAPPRPEQAEVLAVALPKVLEAAGPLFDIVVACTGASWTEAHLQLLERSTAALFLVDQRIGSVRACQRAVDLCVRCGIATGQFLYAVNRCSRNALFTSIDVSCALDGAHVVELKDGGREVEELLGSGAPGALLEAGNAFCESVGALLGSVLGPNARPGGIGPAGDVAGSQGSVAGGRRRKRAKGAKPSRFSTKRQRRGAARAAVDVPFGFGEGAAWA